MALTNPSSEHSVLLPHCCGCPPFSNGGKIFVVYEELTATEVTKISVIGWASGGTSADPGVPIYLGAKYDFNSKVKKWKF